MCDVLAIFVYTALPVISILLLMAKGVQGQSVTSLTKSRIHLLLISMLHLAFRIQATLVTEIQQVVQQYPTNASGGRVPLMKLIGLFCQDWRTYRSTRMGKLLLVSMLQPACGNLTLANGL